MGRRRYTYTFMVELPTTQWKRLQALSPVYIEEDARSVVQGWWNAKALDREALQLTVHLSALMTKDYLVEGFQQMDTIPPLRQPRARVRRWVLVLMPPEAMDASAATWRRLKRGAGKRKKTTLSSFRHAALRKLILDWYK